MTGDWLSALPAFLVGVALLIAPGLIIRLAGWDPRSVGLYFLAPALSVAVIAVASNLAPFVGLRWSLIPVAIVTAATAAVAFGLRRWVGRESLPTPRWGLVVTALVALAAAAVVLAVQLIAVFGHPGNISQTFDDIVHLNSLRLALDTGDSSALGIGRTSDIGFYPNAWHSLVTLVAQMTGANIPIAVNATDLAVGAIAWPASCIALATAFFGERRAVILSSAALSTAFGAFPILLLSFGVLFPNMMGYALLPAGLAATWQLVHVRGTPQRVRAALLLAVVAGGIGLGHPNAFLALFALGTFMVIAELFVVALTTDARRRWMMFAIVAGTLLAVGAVLWRFARTGSAMSRWGPWTGTWQALGEGALASPHSFSITAVSAALIVLGLVAAIARPRRIAVIAPFAVALFMFVLVSGTGYSFFRDMVTNPWYNDSFRLAALLPAAAVPVAVLGAVTVVDGAALLARRWSVPNVLRMTIAVIASAGMFVTLGAGPNIQDAVAWGRGAYVLDQNSALLTSDELRLIGRLDATTPSDALILGNPWTGTSLAYALADRSVVEKHIFGTRTPDELFLEKHLRSIDSDPRVCEALDRAGVTYILDFGSQNVFNDPSAGLDHAGMNDLPSSQHLTLIDSEGRNARLFRLTGC